MLLFLAAWIARLRSGPPHATGEITLAGLTAPVEIVRDSLGIPHIWAESDADAFFAQGYLHASDRLWQMEMFRRIAAGRLSELFGERTLETDRFLRTLGLRRAAELTPSVLQEESVRLVEAYTRGVNAAIDGWSGPLPPEFVLLRSSPEPWEPAVTFSLEKIMAWDLSEYAIGLELSRARSQLGDDVARQLMPRYPEWGVTILEGEPDVPSGRARSTDDEAATFSTRYPLLPEALVAGATPPPPAAALLAAASTVHASNSWVVGPRRSASGRPLVANDMHLALNLPTLWYLVGLHAPGLDVVGVSLPGTPGIVVGRNRAVAWGFTNAMVDDSDFFIERVAPGDSTRYLTPDGAESFVVREEAIEVRGRNAPEIFTVRETRHGPVITPVEARAGGELLSFRWAGHDPSTTFEGLRAMNRAENVAEFLAGVERFTNPHQNIVFADTSGSFGYRLAGRIPLRASGSPPLLPVEGWTGEHDWIGYLPFEEHPGVLDPDEGFIVTANNLQTREPVAALINDGNWFGPHRAQRIRELILARDVHDPGSMRAIQNDVGSAFTDRHASRAVAALREAGREADATALAEWDRRATPESRAATLFFTWVGELHTAYRTRLYGVPRGHFPLAHLERILERGGAELDSLAVEAARAASEIAADLPWGEAHQLVLDHPMAEVPVMGGVFGFGAGPLPHQGSRNSINVAQYAGNRPPFQTRYGASQRMVADLATPGGSFILPGGQSGHPRNPHSRDQLERWRAGELWSLSLDRRDVESVATGRLRILPRLTPTP